MSLYYESALSEDEFAELDAFLLALDDDESLSVDEAHGYLTALVVGPEGVQKATWLPTVWGSAPEFADESERSYMTDILERMHGEIGDALRQGRRFEPLIIEEEDENGETVEAYEGWCFGFMRGVAEYPQHWESLPKKEQELLTPIAKLALLCTDEEGVEMDEEEYETCVELLPGAVAALFSYWHPGAS